MPLMNPSTTERATSSRFPTRARTTGSTNRAPVNPPAWISLRISHSLRLSTNTRSGDQEKTKSVVELAEQLLIGNAPRIQHQTQDLLISCPPDLLYDLTGSYY